jgi:nicotinamidase-related amidase
MIRQLLKKRRKWILIDINTQKDFFSERGNTCIRNRRRVLANVRRVIAWARHNGIRVISTCEVYPNHNGASEGGYCIDGTEGQKKIRYTVLNNRANFPADNNTDLPADLLRQYRQVVLHKRCVDPFDEPRIERLLSEVRADNFVIIGASVEGSVKATALGLLQRGKKVSVVTDAVGLLNKREAKMAFRKMKAKGARLIETKNIAGVSHLKGIGIRKDCRSDAEKTRVRIRTEY